MKTAQIIVTFNPNLSKFKDCINAHMLAGSELIYVIDNGSENFEDLKGMLMFLDSSVINLFGLKKNVGLATAINIGVNHCRSLKFKYVILFDQDSIPSANMTNKLVIKAENLSKNGVKYAAIGPVHIDSRTQSEYPLSKFFGPFIKKIWPSAETSDTIEVDFIITSGTLIPLMVLDFVGGMRDNFFIDCIDIEWCLRARVLNYKILAIKNVVMQHSIGDSRVISLGNEISIHSPLRRYYISRNTLLLARVKSLPFLIRARFFMVPFFTAPRFLLAVGFDNKYVFAILMGLWHGILGRAGIKNE